MTPVDPHADPLRRTASPSGAPPIAAAGNVSPDSDETNRMPTDNRHAGFVLVVDDDVAMRELVSDILTDRGHRVIVAGSGVEAVKSCDAHNPDVVLTDLRMKGMHGLEVLAEIKRRHPQANVILMTAFGSVETAVEAMKHGAYDYLTKPVKSDDLVLTIERAIREAELRREVSHLRRAVGQAFSFHQLVGKSKAMREVFDLIQRVAESPTNILISGESGTGKELVAKAIHFNSDRKQGPFVAINCAAIPETLLESELFGHLRGAFTDAKTDRRGLFEEADKGTLFLDEIGELPVTLQAKLLRAIQEKEIRRVGSPRPTSVDVRIIAATNVDLTEEAKAKRFREDLFYRLNVIEIRLPPLRDRREDIPLLVETFLEKCARALNRPARTVAEAAMARLVDYPWPGNVRELENVIERAVTLSRTPVIAVEDLPATVREARGEREVIDLGVDRDWPLQEVERRYILRILDKTGGNKVQAAQLLGIDRKTLYRKLAEIGESAGEDA
ncbi:MAG: sigma-54 dependent transcriptional regulator [Nitrospiraceae bacterium]